MFTDKYLWPKLRRFRYTLPLLLVLLSGCAVAKPQTVQALSQTPTPLAQPTLVPQQPNKNVVISPHIYCPEPQNPLDPTADITDEIQMFMDGNVSPPPDKAPEVFVARYANNGFLKKDAAGNFLPDPAKGLVRPLQPAGRDTTMIVPDAHDSNTLEMPLVRCLVAVADQGKLLQFLQTPWPGPLSPAPPSQISGSPSGNQLVLR